jgi:hypothetical protein
MTRSVRIVRAVVGRLCQTPFVNPAFRRNALQTTAVAARSGDTALAPSNLADNASSPRR